MDFTIIIALAIFLTAIVIAFWLGNKFGESRKNREWEKQIPNLRNNAISKSRAVLGGQFSEQIAPYLPDFKYVPTECRFIGKPVDFIVFKGMNEKNIKEIIFLEIKSGNSKLNTSEKQLKNTIESNNVRFEEYRVPKDITKKED